MANGWHPSMLKKCKLQNEGCRKIDLLDKQQREKSLSDLEKKGKKPYKLGEGRFSSSPPKSDRNKARTTSS